MFLATLSDWCLDSVCFSSPDCFSSRVAVVKKMAAKGDIIVLSELCALLYLFAAEICEISLVRLVYALTRTYTKHS